VPIAHAETWVELIEYSINIDAKAEEDQQHVWVQCCPKQAATDPHTESRALDAPEHVSGLWYEKNLVQWTHHINLASCT